MLTDSSASSLVSRCADEYLERLRRGERPTVAEYVQRFPQLAERLREYLPLVSMLEDVGEEAGSDSPLSQSEPTGRVALSPIPERLGDYQLLREIGRGGMGIIFEAEQLSLGRRVALKLLMAPRALDETGRARFQREARVASRLHHTNIVPVYEVGHTEGWWFYSMQFITGRPLDAVLHELRRRRAIPDSPLTSATEASSSASRDASPTSPGTQLGERQSDVVEDKLLDSLVARLLGGADYFRQVAALVVQAAEALAFAHLHGVVHRDIKPANLLLDPNGQLWIADFGLARATELNDEHELTQTGDFVGTMKYMAPEQFRGRGDELSDLFSLGLVLYESLTLHAAFETSARWQQLRSDQVSVPVSPRSIEPRVPRDLATICEKCLEPDPARRMASARELADELHRFLRGEPIRSRPIPWWSRLDRWCRRNPMVASLSAALLLAMVVGFSVAVWQAARFRSLAKFAQTGWDNAESNAVRAANEASRATKLADAERVAREESDHNLYVAHMNLVQEAVESGNARQGIRLLELHRPQESQPDRRGFEWHYWNRVLHRDAGEFEPHGAALRSFALSPASQWIAISGEPAGGDFSEKSSAVVQLCDARTRRTLRRWSARAPHIAALMFLDETRLVGGSARGELIVWNVADGTELARWSAHRAGVTAMCRTADSSLLVIGTIDGTVSAWDVAASVATVVRDETQPRRLPKPLWHWTGAMRVMDLDLSPDGRQVVGGCFDQRVRLWETKTGQVVRELSGHSREATTVAACPARNAERPDDWTILSGGADRTLRAWSSLTGEPLWSRDIESEPETLKVIARPTARPDEPLDVLCATADWHVRLLSLHKTAAPRASLVGHGGPVRHLHVSNDGQQFFSASIDGTSRAWSLEQATRPDELLGHTDPVFAACTSADGRWLASVGRDRVVWRWDLQTRRGEVFVPQLPSNSQAIEYSPSDERLAVATSNRVWLVDEAGRTTRELAGPKRFLHALAWHPNGRWLAAAGQDPVIHIWDTHDGSLVGHRSGHTAIVRGLAFSSDGRQLASCSDDGTLRIWPWSHDLANSSVAEPLIARGHTGFVRSLVWDQADQSLFTASSDGTIRQWRADDGQPLRTLGGNSGPLFNVLLSRDGRTLFSTGHDKHVRLLDVRTGEQITTLKGHTQRLAILTQTPDGHTLITGGQDRSLRLWLAKPE